MLGSVNEFYSNALSEQMKFRTRASLLLDAGLGLHLLDTSTLMVIPILRPILNVRHCYKRDFASLPRAFRAFRFFENCDDLGLRSRRGKRVAAQTFHKLLKNPFFCGLMRMPSDLGFGTHKGAYKALVSEALFQEVQAVLKGKKPVPKRKMNPDLPLKSFIRCSNCNTVLTGAFCRGKTGRVWPYYWCRKGHGKMIPAAILEEQFLELLRTVYPHGGHAGEDSEWHARFMKTAAKVWTDARGDVESNSKRLQSRLEVPQNEKG